MFLVLRLSTPQIQQIQLIIKVEEMLGVSQKDGLCRAHLLCWYLIFFIKINPLFTDYRCKITEKKLFMQIFAAFSEFYVLTIDNNQAPKHLTPPPLNDTPP